MWGIEKLTGKPSYIRRKEADMFESVSRESRVVEIAIVVRTASRRVRVWREVEPGHESGTRAYTDHMNAQVTHLVLILCGVDTLNELAITHSEQTHTVISLLCCDAPFPTSLALQIPSADVEQGHLTGSSKPSTPRGSK